jgi:hypothetical protein
VLDKINRTLKVLLKDQNAGEIRMHTKDLNYDQLWKDYNTGHITGSELRKMLFQHH